MHTEENRPPAEDSRYESAATEIATPARTQESGGALASPPRAEEWSAFTPSNDKLEDILSIPEEPLEVSAPVVQVEVLEDVFSVETDTTPAASSESFVAVGGVALQSSVDEGDALHTSLVPTTNEPTPVENPGAPVPAYDKYAVGMRILRVSPAWLLVSTLGFISIIVLFGWMSRPAGRVEASALDAAAKNEATNQSLPPAPVVAAAETAPAPPVKAAKEEPTQQPSQEPRQPPQESRPQEVAPPSETAAGAGNFTVQVGSYPDASQANERVSALRAVGLEARAAAVEIPKRGTWYRVQAGRFQTREEATRFGAQLRAKGAADNVIVAEVEKR
ncbi:MAG TPA: SPOR domain-containing protein [Pyrinomonadaceae bacterium]|nr:SPOR domain-containing protein [Pyrinomonadaceae bacterium]